MSVSACWPVRDLSRLLVCRLVCVELACPYSLDLSLVWCVRDVSVLDPAHGLVGVLAWSCGACLSVSFLLACIETFSFGCVGDRSLFGLVWFPPVRDLAYTE